MLLPSSERGTYSGGTVTSWQIDTSRGDRHHHVTVSRISKERKAAQPSALLDFISLTYTCTIITAPCFPRYDISTDDTRCHQATSLDFKLEPNSYQETS